MHARHRIAEQRSGRAPPRNRTPRQVPACPPAPAARVREDTLAWRRSHTLQHRFEKLPSGIILLLHNYPLTAPAVRPLTRNRWKANTISKGGMLARTPPVAIMP